MALNLPLEGGCICGSVRYSVAGVPLAVFVCHCRNCQQRTGSAFSLSMITWRRDFKTIQGASLWQDLPGGSGALHRQHVCGECLTRTHTDMQAYPDIVNVRPGTLDNPQAVSPIAQCWTRMAHAWAIVPGLQSFEKNLTDVPVLMATWQSQHE